MIIDETIEKYRDIAKGYERALELFVISNNQERERAEIIIKEKEQLVEWLQELKQLRLEYEELVLNHINLEIENKQLRFYKKMFADNMNKGVAEWLEREKYVEKDR